MNATVGAEDNLSCQVWEICTIQLAARWRRRRPAVCAPQLLQRLNHKRFAYTPREHSTGNKAHI